MKIKQLLGEPETSGDANQGMTPRKRRRKAEVTYDVQRPWREVCISDLQNRELLQDKMSTIVMGGEEPM